MAGLVWLVLPAPPASGQISPGPLSRPHAKLEGSGQCLRCHETGRGVSPQKCLGCHDALAKRVAAGRGLHARAEYRDCKTCHVEHQGHDAELVWWGRQGRPAFDHSLTGHRLDGRHAALACERCHRPPGYLGLPTGCSSCHADEHRGQFAGRACSQCHGQAAWKPAAGFDHARSAWPLTGRHASVGCERCHTRRAPDAAKPGASYVAFRAVAGGDCASCHRDVHQGRLGASCRSCHSPSGWRGGSRADFDHARTGYPLHGRHATVACDRCHRPGQPMRLAHAQCTDCHRDPHGGTGAPAREAGRCERCHDVNGFRPAKFGPDEHAKTAYPLAGAHLAVACDACHRRPAGAPAANALPLRLTARRCAECHRDPHRGELAALVARSGCEACHRVDSWRQVSFDHAQTDYPLAGRHAGASCTACHLRAPAAGAGRQLGFASVPAHCAACHADPHGGQLARAGEASSCERCHTPAGFRPARFDHQRDAGYKLDGAHVRLPCSACHRAERHGASTLVRYKPLPKTCSGCHGPGRTSGKGGPS